MLCFIMVVPSFGIMHICGGVVIVGLLSLVGVLLLSLLRGGASYGLFVCLPCSLGFALYLAIESVQEKEERKKEMYKKRKKESELQRCHPSSSCHSCGWLWSWSWGLG